jgi:hypothetical protein
MKKLEQYDLDLIEFALTYLQDNLKDAISRNMEKLCDEKMIFCQARYIAIPEQKDINETLNKVMEINE